MSHAEHLSPADVNGRSADRISLSLICLCFVLSGVAALVYQVVWARKFALVFGTSELAIAAVLAAYMGGLALGAWIIEKCIVRVRRPLAWYASIEVGIAVAALALVPAGQWLVELVLVTTFGGQSAPPDAVLGVTSFYYLAAAFLVLLLPTTLMGATLPLLARYAVHHEMQIGSRVGLLYACNTAGAVGGALLGAIVLLPGVGLTKTVWVAVAINLAVALLAWGLGQTSLSRPPAAPSGRNRAGGVLRERFRAGVSPAWVLPLMLISGAVSFLHEVLWTRMLGHVIGSSIYAFGVMLASFLAGIALGGGLGAMLARYRESAARWLAVSELAAAIAAVGAWYALQNIDLDMGSLSQRIAFGFGLLFMLAFAIGLTYPLAVRVLARDVGEAASGSARVYSWNTVGAILGAVAGGFLIVPAMRYEGAVRIAVITSCVLALVACFALFRPGKRFAASITVVALAVSVLFVPRIPDSLLRYSPLQESGAGELLHYDVGRSAAVVSLRLGDLIDIRSNGLPEAAIDLRGTSPRFYGEAWMVPLAVLARPRLRELLVVGFGGGRVLEAVPRSVESVDVIELEKKIVEANRVLTERGLRDPARDPLLDERIRLVINDARGALQLTTKTYDAIVSQPSHPWTAGASHLYTREFMQQARQHLEPGGVFVQWMNTRFLDEQLLRSLVATMKSVYTYLRVYRPDPATLLFLASDSPIAPETDIQASSRLLALSPGLFGRLGLNTVEDLVVSLALDDPGATAFARDGEVITDDDNRFAVASVHEFGDNLAVEDLGRLLLSYDPLLENNGLVHPASAGSLAVDYMARRILASASIDGSARLRLQRLAEQMASTDMAPYLNALATSDGISPVDAEAVLPQSADSLILRAESLAAVGEWQAVVELVPELAGVAWSSIHKPQAVRLQVESRIRTRLDVTAKGLDAESIELIDRLSLTDPDPQLFLLRAMCAGDDPRYLAESLFRYALAVLQGRIEPQQVPRTEFEALHARFAGLDAGAAVHPYHLAEVRNVLDAAAARITDD